MNQENDLSFRNFILLTMGSLEAEEELDYDRNLLKRIKI